MSKHLADLFLNLISYERFNARQERVLLSFYLTKGNVDDRNIKVMAMTKEIFGKLFGDKGYISQALSELHL